MVSAIKALARAYGYRIEISRMEWDSTYSASEKLIRIGLGDLKDSTQAVINSFFHELGHAMAKESGKFRIYHDDRVSHKNIKFKQTALRAERYVDEVASRTQKAFFPDIPYVKRYSKKSGRKFLREFYGWD